MLSHIGPSDLTIRLKQLADHDNSLLYRVECRAFSEILSAWRAASRSAVGHGPLRVEHHVAAGCQGAGIDPGIFPLGARTRRLRRTLLLSDPRPGGDRCRRPRA